MGRERNLAEACYKEFTRGYFCVGGKTAAPIAVHECFGETCISVSALKGPCFSCIDYTSKK